MDDSGHGFVGTREAPFTSILPSNHKGYPVGKLADLAQKMISDLDQVHDGPDPEENLWVPAGYTYFGQFVDHDLTFDSTSSLNPEDASAKGKTNRVPSNLRSPRFDLDCVYGDGPDAQPFMYDADGVKLLLGGKGKPKRDDPKHADLQLPETADQELARASNDRAIIGDKRNDENSIVNHIQQGFIRYHNYVVDQLTNKGTTSWSDPNSLFKSARNEVRWTYQRLVLEDFLPRIISSQVLSDLEGKTSEQRKKSYVLYTERLRTNLPREFVAAAYRFGHSGVRFGYRLNRGTILPIFNPSTRQDKKTIPDASDDSLLGFDPLPKHHVIDDWKRFFDDSDPTKPNTTDDRKRDSTVEDTSVKLQFAYKLDTNLVDPLGVLPGNVAGGETIAQTEKVLAAANHTQPDPARPSLALLNLLRGNIYKIHGGQAYAARLIKKFPKAEFLTKDFMVVRVPAGETAAKEKLFKFESINPSFYHDTPLWFYILAEAQMPVVKYVRENGGKDKEGKDGDFKEGLLLNGAGAKTQLGYVGGRIVAEVMYGLIDSDPESVMGDAAKGWKPILVEGNRKVVLLNLLNLAGLPPQT